MKIKKTPPVMNRNEIIQRLRTLNLQPYKVTRLALFGSAARDELRKRSDVDILVEFSALEVDNFFNLQFLLEEVLGRRVDLVTRKAIKPAMLPYIQGDLYNVPAA
jgi:predicted nucleotidyltransferase